MSTEVFEAKSGVELAELAERSGASTASVRVEDFAEKTQVVSQVGASKASALPGN